MVALVAERHGEKLRPGRELANVAEVRLDGKRLVLAFPQTYMNESGRAVARLARRYKVEDMARLVVVHDELDLPLGTVRVKEGGGLAGHNGLRSIQAHLHTDGFARIRIGIGKPPGNGADHVLHRPSRADRELIDGAVSTAADAVEVIAASGITAAMNRFNAKAKQS